MQRHISHALVPEEAEAAFSVSTDLLDPCLLALKNLALKNYLLFSGKNIVVL